MSPFARDRVCRREWCSQPCQERLGSSGGWAAGGWGWRRGAVLALLLRPLGGALLARGLRKCDLLNATVGNVDLPRVGADCFGVRSHQHAEPTRRCPCTRSWERASATPALRGARGLGHGRKLLPGVLLRWPGCPPSRGCTSSFPTYQACLSVFSLCLFVVD